MEQLKDTVAAWLRSGLGEDGRMETACYGNHLLMTRLTGTDFHLSGDWLPLQWHVFLHVHQGELRLTADDDRLGFDASVYVDFLSNFTWKDMTLVGAYRATVIVVEQNFFLESSQSIRNRITDGMMFFSQSPFTPLEEAEQVRLQRLEDAIFSTLQEDGNLFANELLQIMVCAWQYELWNIFFHRKQAVRTDGVAHWKGIVSHFLYLAHTHCREKHEVGWYARQTGVSADSLSAMLKRLYGKSASTILSELLAREAKVCLRNPLLSVQQVAEMLGFADQSAFGKFFKRHCGMSPGVYRKKLIKEQVTDEYARHDTGEICY